MTENQIFRIPYKYKELFESMDKTECWKLIIALMQKNSKWLENLTLTYYNIVIVDIENIEKQVKKWQEWGKKWGRPKKEKTLGVIKEKTPPFQNEKPKISKDKLSEDKISKDKRINKGVFWEFKNVYITQEEIKKLENMYWIYAPMKMIEELSAYIENVWDKYENHYLTILNWMKRKNIMRIDITPWF